MEVKQEILFIVGLLFLIAVLAAAMNYFSMSVGSADAGNFVLEDLSSKYPKADIGILKTMEKYNDAGQKYFEIKAKITEEYSSACPKRSHIYYNYPVQNFVPAPAEKITTQNCNVCTSGTCVINYPEEAIIASHTLKGTSEVHSFLQTHLSATPTVIVGESNWIVKWKDDTVDMLYTISMDRNGNILSVVKEKLPK